MKKKIFQLISLLLIVSFCFSTIALSVTSAEPRWINTALVHVSLGFSNAKAHCGVAISAETGAHFDNGTITLYKWTTSGYIPVRIWSNLSDRDDEFTWTNTWVSVVEGTTYKLVVDIDVIRNGITENITVSKEAMYISG